MRYTVVEKSRVSGPRGLRVVFRAQSSDQGLRASGPRHTVSGFRDVRVFGFMAFRA